MTEAKNPELYPESFEKYGIWETKKCYLHLYQENEIFINWKEKELSAFGGMNAYDVAQKGFEEHKSQVTYFSMSLDSRARYGNGLFGLYSTTVGPDVLKNDFLENIPKHCLTTWVEPEPEITETEPVPDSKTTDMTGMQSNEKPIDYTAFNVTVFVVISVVSMFATVSLILFFIKRKTGK